MKFKIGDIVVVIAGKHRKTKGPDGKPRANTGKVLKTIPEKNRIVVEGINIVKRHMRKTQQRPGQIVEFEAPIHVSNVMLIDPKTKKRTRIGYKTDPKAKKKRVAKKSNSVL